MGVLAMPKLASLLLCQVELICGRCPAAAGKLTGRQKFAGLLWSFPNTQLVGQYHAPGFLSPEQKKKIIHAMWAYAWRSIVVHLRPLSWTVPSTRKLSIRIDPCIIDNGQLPCRQKRREKYIPRMTKNPL